MGKQWRQLRSDFLPARQGQARGREIRRRNDEKGSKMIGERRVEARQRSREDRSRGDERLEPGGVAWSTGRKEGSNYLGSFP